MLGEGKNERSGANLQGLMKTGKMTAPGRQSIPILLNVGQEKNVLRGGFE